LLLLERLGQDVGVELGLSLVTDEEELVAVVAVVKKRCVVTNFVCLRWDLLQIANNVTLGVHVDDGVYHCKCLDWVDVCCCCRGIS
jgi:hypothetical protein